MAKYIKQGFDKIPTGLQEYFPEDRYEYFRTKIKGELKDVDGVAFFKSAVKKILKERDWEDEEDVKRWLIILLKRIHHVEEESADTLFSLFSETHFHRYDKIHTRIEENVLLPERMDSPANMDYPAETPQFVSTGECIISVEHKRRDLEPFIRCDDCNGSGWVKCEHCEGTGREQYVDGYYANGEERIKTGACHECEGRGRIPCPKCMGEGKIAVYSPEYSIVKSVDETVYHNVYALFFSPWQRKPARSLTDYYDPDPQEDDDNDPESRVYRHSVSRAAKEVFGMAKGNYVVKKKNRHEIEVDASGEVLEELKKFGMEEAYYENLKSLFNADDPLVSREEMHILVPVKRIKAVAADNNVRDFALYAFEDGKGSVRVAMPIRNTAYLNTFKYILLWLYYFLVSIGKLVIGFKINKLSTCSEAGFTLT